MKTILLGFTVLFMSLISFSQTTVFHENFELPSLGDSVSSTGTPGASMWSINTSLFSAPGIQSYRDTVTLGDTVYLTTNAFSTLGNTAVMLYFDQICKIEYFDAGEIEVSNNNGATWVKLTSLQYLGAGQFASTGNKFSSTSYIDWLPANGGAVPTNSWWKSEAFDIGSLVANSPQVKIRFVLRDANNTGSAGNYGWLLDNIRVTMSFSELIPPVITMVPPILQDTVYQSTPYNIKAVITDLSGIDTAYIAYSVNTGQIDTIGMVMVGPDTFAGSIPFYGYGRTILYKVFAFDASAAANSTISPATGSRKIYAKYSPGGSFIIGAGTATSYFYGPLYRSSSSSSFDYSMYSSLISADEFAAAGVPAGGAITQIEWYKNDAFATTGNAIFKIYLKNSSLTALPASDTWSNIIAAASKVYDNSATTIPTTVGWIPFSITPFAYSGGGLEVSTDWNISGVAGNPSTGAFNFRYTTGLNGNKTIGNANSTAVTSLSTGSYGGTLRPNIRLTFAGAALALDAGIGQIVNPTGGVIAGTPFNVTVRVKNFGSDTLNTANVKWTVDGVTQTQYAFTGPLLKDSLSANITLGSITLGQGIHTIKVWTDNPNGVADFNFGNDTLQITFMACANLLSGTYTIGGATPDFPNISSAVVALQQCGINGPVLFNIAPGTYNEQVEIPLINGSSATNTVTFKSANNDSSSVIMAFTSSSAANNYIVKLNGAKYVTLKNLKFQPLGSAFANALVFANGAQDNEILGNFFSGKTGTSYDLSLIRNEDVNSSNNLISGNRLDSSSVAIYMKGVSASSRLNGVKILNNTITSFFATGIRVEFVNEARIEGNTINSTLLNSGQKQGVELVSAYGISRVIGNKIALDGGYNTNGIHLNNCVSTDSTRALIANNFISILSGTNFTYGIRLLGTTAYQDLVYNSILVNGTNSTDTRGVNPTTTASNIRVLNNNIQSNKFPTFYEGSSVSRSDYNNLFSTGSVYAYYTTSLQSFTSFNAYRTALQKDSNSVSTFPYFNSLTDLHTMNGLINGLATPLANVPTDIDGQPRNATTPDIGADEFIPSSKDATILAMLNPVSGCGLDSTTIVTLQLKNVGSDTISSGLSVNMRINGGTVITEPVSAIIPPNTTYNYSFNTTVMMDMSVFALDSTFNFAFWVSLTGDLFAANDSIFQTVVSKFTPPVPTTQNVTVPYGTSGTLVATTLPNNFIAWFDSQTSTNKIATGDTLITPILFANDTFWVEAYNVKAGEFNIGTGTNVNTNTGYPAPYGNYFNGARHQMLILASELQAMGLSAGAIDKLGFDVVTVNGAALTNFSISLGLTALNVASGSTPFTNLTPVYTAATYTEVAGWNMHVFQTPFTWDGVSNVVVETCFDNYGVSSYTYNAIVNRTQTTFTSVLYYNSDQGSVCVSPATATSNIRPNMKISIESKSCASTRIPVVAIVSGIPTEDIGVSAIYNNEGCRLTTTETVKIDIYNQGTSPVNGGFTAAYRINNNPYIIPENVTDTLAPGDTITYTFNTPAYLYWGVDTTFSLHAYVALATDPLKTNDSIQSLVFESNYTPNDPTAVSPVNVSFASPAVLTASGAAGDKLKWYNSQTSMLVLDTGSVYTTPYLMYQTDTFYVEAVAGGFSGTVQLGTGTLQNGVYGYPTPYGNYYYGNHEQYLIPASELIAMGVTAGEIVALAFDVATPASAALVNFTIGMGHTQLTALTGFVTTPVAQVFTNSSQTTVSGWNTHTFQSPFTWDGLSNVVVDVCFNNSSYVDNGIVNQTTTTYAATYNLHADDPGVCAGTAAFPTTSTYNQRPNMKFTVNAEGCASNRVEVIALIGNQAATDVGVSKIHQPNSAIFLGSSEPVSVQIKNYGSQAVSNISVIYKVDNQTPVTETYAGPIAPGDTVDFNFSAMANLNVLGQAYSFKSWTTVAGDNTTSNDTAYKVVTNIDTNYCVSTATSPAYEDISRVKVSNLDNTSGSPGSMYSNFTNLPPAILSIGNLDSITVVTDFPPTYSYQYSCWVNAFIDWNRDGVFDPNTEKFFSKATQSSALVSDTFTVPANANPGLTLMRVVMRESGTTSNTGPCGTYNWGETEDYMVLLLPVIQYDAGVVGILSPSPLEDEGDTIPVIVMVKNFGSDTLTSIPLNYTVAGTAINTNYTWTGTLLPGAIDTITMPSMTVPAGNRQICAKTLVVGDANYFNDANCANFYGTPIEDAYLTEVLKINEGCGLGLDTVSIRIRNIGWDTIPAGFTAKYKEEDGPTVISAIVNQSIAPNDSILFHFPTLFNFSVTTFDSTYKIIAWVEVPADNVEMNDTASVKVLSVHTPPAPITSNVTVPYASPANLTATSTTGDKLYWYASDTTQTHLDTGNLYVTPLMYATDTFYVEAKTSISFTGGLNVGANIAPQSTITGVGLSTGTLDWTRSYDGDTGTITSGQQCWISTATPPNGTEYWDWNWTQPYTISSVKFYLAQNTARTLTGATFQVWNGTTWVNHHTWVQPQGPFSFTINFPPVTTTKLRCTGFQMTGIGQLSNPNFREIEVLLSSIEGCSSARVPVIVTVGAPAQYDAGAFKFVEPVSAVNMGANETVKIKIRNYGTQSISAFQASFKVDNLTAVTETVAGPLASGDSMEYTFLAKANLSSVGTTYQLKAWTTVTGDNTPINDTVYKSVTNMLPNYCPCAATSPSYEDISRVKVSNLDNFSGSPGSMYTDFTNLPPALLSMGLTDSILVSTDFPPSYTYQYPCWVNVFIDWNRDGTFDPIAERVFSMQSQSQNTVADTFTVPFNASPGLTRMRVVMRESGTAGDTGPCGTFTWGEAEDYLVQVAPLVGTDAGVQAITSPTGTVSGGTNVPVTAIVRNYGTNPILPGQLQVKFQLDNSPIFTVTVQQTLQSLDTLTVSAGIWPVPTGQHQLCVWTVLTNDSVTFNDQKCMGVFGELYTTVPYSDDMEGTVYWNASGTKGNWQHGVPAGTTINAAHSPTKVWMTNLASNYDNSANELLYTPRFNFSGLLPTDTATLKFWHWYSTETANDGGHLQYSVNGGQTWISLGTIADPDATNWYITNIGGTHVFSGSSAGWMQSTIKLSPTVFNGQSLVQFRFRFFSNASTNSYDGWAIDDFSITLPMQPNDVGVDAIISPPGGSIVGSQVTVTVRLKNFGANTQTSFPVSYKVNNDPPVTATWTGSLATNATANYTFAVPYTSPSVNYQLCAYTSLVGDGFTPNNQICAGQAILPAPFDAGVIEVVNPKDSVCKDSWAKPVIVKLTNFGTSTITTMGLQYQINSATAIVETWNGSLLPGDTILYTFNTLYTPPIGIFNMCAQTNLSLDANIANDKSCNTVKSVTCLGIDENGLAGMELGQNRPNPASDLTQIDVILPNDGKLLFEVVNLLGQVVESKQIAGVAGTQTIELNLANLESGVYYYSIRFNGYSMTKKMVIE